MKNTGITYTSAERSPVILPEMAELLPPLSAEQSAALEEDLLRNGCYSPVIARFIKRSAQVRQRTSKNVLGRRCRM